MGSGHKVRGHRWGDGEMSGIRIHGVKSTKNQKKLKKIENNLELNSDI